MRLPASLLSQMRTCVGVGALLTTAGCDQIPTPQALEVAVPSAPQTAAPAPARAGLAGKVATVVESSKEREAAPSAEPLPEIGESDAAPPPAQAEDVTEFVPFGGAVAESKVPPRPRIRRPVARKLAAAEEPCETEVAASVPTGPTWVDPCPPCGRG
jgi:hypothetical protein